MATQASTVQVVMPAMGDSVAEGTVLEWRKREGDSVAADETIVEISTDKVDAEVPAPVAGRLAKILAPEGETISVGAPLAEIATENGAQSAEAPEPPTEPEATTASQGANDGAPAVAAPPSDGAKTIDIVTPTGGESVTEGSILEWTVQVGEPVKQGDTVVVISTDKVDMELPAPGSGTVSEVLAEEGATVTVGEVIGRIRAEAPAQGAPQGQAASPPATPASQPPAPAEPDAIAESTQGETEAGNVSPIARRIAAQQGIDLSTVEGSARGGRITKADVLAAAGNGDGAGAVAPPKPSAPPSQAPQGAEPLRGGAAVLARYMEESRSVPTATSFRTFAVSVLEQRRAQLKDAGRRVSFTHVIAYAIAIAATEDMPVMATHFAEIDGKPHRIEDGACNLGLAVDVEKKDGSRTLMVPVIGDAGRMRFGGFVQAYNSLVEKARTNALTADELSGGNLTLTNPGGIGTVASVPRLMTGQGTIVATGAISYPPGLDRVGRQLGAEKVMTMTSTYDHRVIQGAESGRFLQRIEAYLKGEDGFYERVFEDLGVELPALVDATSEAPPATAPTPPAPGLTPIEDGAATRPPVAKGAPPDEEMLQAVQAATSLLKAHRTHGHLAARLDPLGGEPESDPSLDPEPLGLTPEIMARIPSRILRMYVPGDTLADALPHLRETYCGPIAYEIEHIASHEQRLWLREKIEDGSFRKPLSAEEQKWLLRRLTEVDALERFMHKAYLGQKQFSVEGLDMTVPMLDELIRLAAGQGAREVVIGMAHRGRLNVLAHNLGRSYDSIFAEFEGSSTLAPITSLPHGGTGDVKYHHGAQGSYQLPSGESITVRLESNPSHLEFVDPVVVGATRAAQTRRQGAHAHQDVDAAIPVILHGDASFPAQGVVAETLNLQALDGYTVGGTVHVIQNNQVGFTTDPDDARSTTWASDLAKGFDVPIIHVNSDDVPACISAVRLAFAFRQRFGHDVLIDLIGYRRFGHNEADEPAYTQPEMYQAIKKHPPVRELFARALIEQGVVSEQESTEMTDNVWSVLSEAHENLKAQIERAKEIDHGTGEYQLDRSASPEVSTAVPADRLRVLNEELLSVPDGFTVHPKLVKQLEQRRAVFADGAASGWPPGRRMGAGRVARVRLAADRGYPHPVDGPGHRARHLQPAPPGSARRQDRPGVLRDAAPTRRAGAHGAAQLATVRDGLRRIRIRLLAGGARDAGALGGAVRRLRQRRAGDHRPVHRLGAGQVGADLSAGAAAAARLRGVRARAFLGAARALPAARRRGQHPHRGLHDARPVLPPAPASGADRQAAAAGADDAKEPAAPETGDQPDRGARPRPIRAGARGAGRGPTRGDPSAPVQRQDLLRPNRPRRAPEQSGRCHGTRGAPVPVPAGRAAAARHELPAPARGRVGPGGAAQHGRPRPYVSAPAADPPSYLHFGYVGRPERAASGEGYPIAHANEQNRIVSTALDLGLPVSQYPREQPGER